MSVKINVNVAKFQEALRSKAQDLQRASRPAAQAGAQIIYDRARSIVASELVSEREHYFYGSATKALPPGKKKAAAYGPFRPGNLLRAIYQVFSESNSFKDQSVYHISFNQDKAPYGFMVELGTSRSPAHSFIGRAVIETRAAVRKAIKQRYLAEVGA